MLCCDVYIIFSEIAITDYQIGLVVHVALPQSGRQVIIPIINIVDALSLLYYYNPKGFHNFIVNLLQYHMK